MHERCPRANSASCEQSMCIENMITVLSALIASTEAEELALIDFKFVE